MIQKLLVGHVAAQMTTACMTGYPEQDPMKRQVAACQMFANFYEWIKNILVDSNWPTPQVDVSLLFGQPAGQPAQPPAPSGGPAPVGPVSLPGAASGTPAAPKAHCRSAPALKDKDAQRCREEMADFLESLMRISPANPTHVPDNIPEMPAL